MNFNYHTHCCYCDGTEAPEQYVLVAIEKGFTHLGFSSHAPVPFSNNFSIKYSQLNEYVETIRSLQKSYADKIKIFLSLEIDYIPAILEDFSALKKECGLDYIIGSVHLVPAEGREGLWFTDGGKIETFDEGLQNLFDGNIKLAVKTFFEQTNAMIINQKPDIIGHFDKVKMNNRKRYFSEEDAWYNNLVMETLSLIKENGCICEINTRGIYKNRYPDYFPGAYLWEKIAKMNIPVTLSSDAHKPEELGWLFEETVQLMKSKGINTLWYFDEGWKNCAIESL